MKDEARFRSLMQGVAEFAREELERESPENAFMLGFEFASIVYRMVAQADRGLRSFEVYSSHSNAARTTYVLAELGFEWTSKEVSDPVSCLIFYARRR